MKSLARIVAPILLTGCSLFPSLEPPPSLGERNSGFTYIPLDPLPVATAPGRSCGDIRDERLPEGVKFREVLDALPDNAVRMAIKEYDAKGKLSFGASSVGSEGRRYQVVLDYINVDSTNIRFYIKLKDDEIVDVKRVDDYFFISDDKRAALPADVVERKSGNIVIPVYVGVGLRLTADLQVLRGTINLSSLGAIAAGVE